MITPLCGVSSLAGRPSGEPPPANDEPLSVDYNVICESKKPPFAERLNH